MGIVKLVGGSIVDGILRSTGKELVEEGAGTVIQKTIKSSIPKTVPKLISTPRINNKVVSDILTDAPSPAKQHYANTPKELTPKISAWLDENKDALLDGTLDRSEFGEIFVAGSKRKIQGMHEYLLSGKKFKLDKVSTITKGAEVRAKNVTPPYQSLVDFADENRIPQEVLAEYLDLAKKGFTYKKEMARTERKQRNIGRNVAGHLSSANKGGPTSGFSSILEDEVLNIVGSDKIVHDLNIYVAELIGVGTNWEEDLLLFAARKQGVKVPRPSDFSAEELIQLIDIPGNWSKDEVIAFYKKLLKQRGPRTTLGGFGSDFGLDEGISKKDALKYFRRKDGTYPTAIQELIDKSRSSN